MEVIQGDITDYSSVLEASRGAHAVVHMASLVDVWHRIPESLIYAVNIKGEAVAGGRGDFFQEEMASRLGGFSRTFASF